MPLKHALPPVQIVVGRMPRAPIALGLDLILPEMPWVKDAVEHAQGNLTDFGIGQSIPALTREDLIISKLHSYQDKKTRYKDLDDLKEIFSSGTDLDLDYLTSKMEELKLSIPDPLREFCHHKILRVSRKLSKGR